MNKKTGRNKKTGIKPKPAVMSWSSGKDSAFALHAARQNPDIEVVGLVSTFNELFDRVAIHGTQRQIAAAQAAMLGLPLIEVNLPYPCSNELYDERIGACVAELKNQNIHDWIFGDLFLEDVRAYREERMLAAGLTPHFPLWGADTRQLAEEMLAADLIANIVTLNPEKMPKSLCGHRFNQAFLDQLPEGIDPCGENGEFHTVVSYAPGFARPLHLVQGQTIEREGFVYTDFSLPADGE
ncbi:MAG: ATP-binding protein [Candidatus Puniceispirillaceae bacterium]